MHRVLLLLVLLSPAGVAGDPQSADFFETRVRPVLVEHCYKCHSDQGKIPKGGLRVDGRAHLLTGGDSGPAIVPGKADAGKFLEAVRYTNPDLLMPPKGKLPAAAIADLEAWVKAGAPWPNDKSQVEAKKEFDIAARKSAHWSWQPVRVPAVPNVQNASWPRDAVDRFLLAKLEASRLQPAAEVAPLVWLRRVTFALTGLPPTPEEIAAFEKSLTNPGAAYSGVVDRLLAAPTFGERWGRHWLDLMRYAETRGHEFDPDVPNAYQYRDYMVRAYNADVPYDQFVKEHLAGDLLPSPRLDPETGANESILGTGFWHLGEEVHSPVDLRQDQADRFDNRIDVFTKAFLGLTVSCARCHDHKFDAISAKDYTALFALLEGSSYRQVRFDGWKQNREVARELAKLRREMHEQAAKSIPQQLQPSAKNADFEAWLAKAKIVVDYANCSPDDWRPDDVTFGPGPVVAGTIGFAVPKRQPELAVEERGAAVFDRFWAGLKEAPGSKRDHGDLGKKLRAGLTIRTANVPIERKTLYYLVRGGGTMYAAICEHTVIDGPLHRHLIHHFNDKDQYRWLSQDVAAYQGMRGHVELTADPLTPFAVAMVVQADTPPPRVPPGYATVQPPVPDEVQKQLVQTWQTKTQELAKRAVWQSRLAPARLDGPAVAEQVFIRGNPRSLGEEVPPRSLEALAGPEAIPHERGSGRLELAEQLTDPEQNPYVARVAVNRIWHHLFGRGLVPTPDNFGELGEPPSHPELLDFLATEFVRDGWSQKHLIRRLVLSSAFRMASTGSDPQAENVDPTNALLHTFRRKRLEGEAIRDAMLAISGRLDRTLGGPSVPVYLTPFLEGRGRPSGGPIDGDGRRSLYLAVRRNFLAPMLQAFDTPIPFSTVGRRQVSNVPAQSLILMNDPFVHQQAELWAKRVLAESGTPEARIRSMYLAAFGRPPTPKEVETCLEFVTAKEALPGWTALAHTLFNVKEFIFVP